MNKIKLLAIACFALLQQATAQGLSINTNGAAPDASAMLDVSGTSKGILLPRLTTRQMLAIPQPANGLLVYNTDYAGFCVYTGTGWQKMLLGTPGNHALSRTQLNTGDLVVDSGRIILLNTGGSVLVGDSAGANDNFNNNRNTAIGTGAGFSNVSGRGNLMLGYNAGYYETGSHKLYIANSNTTTPLIYGDFSNRSVTINDILATKYLKLSTGAANGYVLQSDASGNASWVSAGTLATTNYWSANGTSIYKNNSGNTGIGTNTPNALLHVKGVGTEGTAAFNGTDNASHFNYGLDGSEDTYIRGGKTSSRVVIGDINSGNILIGSSSSKTGIGTSSPTGILHTVASGAKTASYSGNLLTNTATSATASVTKAAVEIKSTGSWSGNSAKNIGLYVSSVTGGTNNYDAIFNGGGYVGVATGSPNATLDVNGSMNHKVVTINTSNNNLTLGSTDYCVIVSGNINGNTITLPAASTCTGRTYLIVNHSWASITCSTYIPAANTYSTTIAAGATVQLMSNTIEWHKIN